MTPPDLLSPPGAPAPARAAFETAFGLSAHPFQLGPDPSLYFASRAHARAMALLKLGLNQGEGFIVVTGAVGAGKTSMVRAMLEALDPARCMVANVLGARMLDTAELLDAIALGFGLPHQGVSRPRLIATLESLFVAGAAVGRRALLVVDEAQNLSLADLEMLRLLSNLQLGSRSLLQCLLVGQPELRDTLNGEGMEQLRQRVVASCSLGALDLTETRFYIEHRLHRRGWNGTPSFDEAAIQEIHAATLGIPRRINLLCTRVLLGCCREQSASVQRPQVQRTAAELRIEFGMPALSSTFLAGLWPRRT